MGDTNVGFARLLLFRRTNHILNMERFFCFLAIVLSWTLPTSAQTRLRFLDRESGAPVSYVHVLFDSENGKYADEEGCLTVPEGVDAFETHHISYESQSIEVRALRDSTVLLVPLVQALAPAIVFPNSYHKRTIGYAGSKRMTFQGGRNGFAIAEFFKPSSDGNATPLISKVLLNLFAVNLKKTGTTSIGEQVYDDAVTHVAKLRVDIREADPVTGGPGASLVDGGVIYEIKDRFSLSMHKIHKIPLKNPVVFPEEGAFVVVEWIITDDVRVQDTILPYIWLTRAETPSSSWNQWPVGTAWKRNNDGRSEDRTHAYCIGLEILE